AVVVVVGHGLGGGARGQRYPGVGRVETGRTHRACGDQLAVTPVAGEVVAVEREHLQRADTGPQAAGYPDAVVVFACHHVGSHERYVVVVGHHVGHGDVAGRGVAAWVRGLGRGQRSGEDALPLGGAHRVAVKFGVGGGVVAVAGCGHPRDARVFHAPRCNVADHAAGVEHADFGVGAQLWVGEPVGGGFHRHVGGGAHGPFVVTVVRVGGCLIRGRIYETGLCDIRVCAGHSGACVAHEWCPFGVGAVR